MKLLPLLLLPLLLHHEHRRPRLAPLHLQHASTIIRRKNYVNQRQQGQRQEQQHQQQVRTACRLF